MDCLYHFDEDTILYASDYLVYHIETNNEYLSESEQLFKTINIDEFIYDLKALLKKNGFSFSFNFSDSDDSRRLRLNRPVNNTSNIKKSKLEEKYDEIYSELGIKIPEAKYPMDERTLKEIHKIKLSLSGDVPKM